MFNPKLNKALLLVDYAMQDLEEQDYISLKEDLENIKKELLGMIDE